jgi:hypothetical protein
VPRRGPDAGALAAWVVKVESQQRGPRDLWLALVDMKSGAVKKTRLWGAPVNPVIAADSSGAHLAVAGNEQHEIWVYQVKDLWNGKTDKQVLKSAAQSVHYVSFAESQGRLGLIVAETPDGTPTRKSNPESAKLFDFKQRRTTTLRGWNDFNADQASWKVVDSKPPPGAQQPSIEVLRAGQKVERPDEIVVDAHRRGDDHRHNGRLQQRQNDE